MCVIRRALTCIDKNPKLHLDYEVYGLDYLHVRANWHLTSPIQTQRKLETMEKHGGDVLVTTINSVWAVMKLSDERRPTL